MEANQLERVARRKLIQVFTARVLKDLAVFGCSERLEEARPALEQLGLIEFDARLSEVFEQAYSVLLDVYPGEYVLLNECLCREMAESSEQGAVYRELAVGASKADLAIFRPRESSGFEIKSRFDRLDRLQGQLQTYQKVFTRTYVVTGQGHAPRVLQESTDSVGVLAVSRQGIRELRPAMQSPDLISSDRLFALLRKHEYLQLIKEEFGAVPDLPNTRIYRACLELFKQIDLPRRQALVSDILHHRKSPPPREDDRAWRLPRSLRALALSGKLDQSQLLRLSCLLERP
jgi:hypothetical protein